ncbi:enoyl-CoA hydratase [Polymorphum gilvum]|uniref:Enoyl-CoA hydratase/isomerase family protein n=1 Tax=Polymorphum gilvum (strain LMG 25793 / CGMCC 1.9160 / SL003B-26A1) TaxID=991905 RepID=F2J514_POLGS|nr:enoyl-CoA hydratase [Polymorphum gilvum]ADZ70056.1 Enoyl-CoA hydratase/isomerase family protein [Polymorphum gilvum SL003B-26A1]
MTVSNEQLTARIHTEVTDAVGWLVVDNAARRNAVTLAMWRAIPPAVAALDADPAVRVIVLRGAGGTTFVAGADISEFETVRGDAASARSYEDENVAAFDALRAAVKPTLAMIRGFCLGGGLGLAAACDLRIAEEGALFGIPAARLGVGYPPSALRDIVNLVGPARTRELLYTARRVDAREAAAIGLVERLVPRDSLDSEIAALCATLAANAPLTLKAGKRAVAAIAGAPEQADWAAVQALTDACFDSADFAEGRNAFLQKRDPVFKGR